MITNPSEMAVFLARLRKLNGKGRRVFVDLSLVTKASPDAILTLVAVIRSRKRSRFEGNYPTAPAAAGMFMESGFVEAILGKPPEKARRGLIREEKGVDVKTVISAEVARDAGLLLYGSSQWCKPAHRTIIECMGNTNDHAMTPGGDPQKWFLSMYCAAPGGPACFTVVDCGRGILNSLRRKGAKVLYERLFGSGGNADFLRRVLAGEVQSSTKLPGRGRGLPKIAQEALSGTIENLIVVSNDVAAFVSRNEYRVLYPEFEGTLIYWEVRGGVHGRPSP